MKFVYLGNRSARQKESVEKPEYNLRGFDMGFTFLSDGQWLDPEGKTIFTNDVIELFQSQNK